MDLFKWAMKLAPWVEASLVGDCLELARDARLIDMRASPYDLTSMTQLQRRRLAPPSPQQQQQCSQQEQQQQQRTLSDTASKGGDTTNVTKAAKSRAVALELRARANAEVEAALAEAVAAEAEAAEATAVILKETDRAAQEEEILDNQHGPPQGLSSSPLETVVGRTVNRTAQQQQKALVVVAGRRLRNANARARRSRAKASKLEKQARAAALDADVWDSRGGGDGGGGGGGDSGDGESAEQLCPLFEVVGEFDVSPILVETVQGRKQYQIEQEELWRRGQPLRRRLIEAYEGFLTHALEVQQQQR